MLLCKYCQKECKNENSLRNHERLCKSNPNRNIEYILNSQEKRTESLRTRKERGTFRNQWSNPDYVMKEETRERIIELNKKQIWDESRRLKHSESMKLAVEKYPESYTSSNRGRTKQFIYNDIKFQGMWELEFYKYCEDNNIKIERSSQWFDYVWNGNRKYNPDFYLPEYDWFVEVKGYKTEKDDAKWSQFPLVLKIIGHAEIKEIRNKKFTLR
jgi:hypothetical protein